ncbi:MAG: hypothetical protein MJ210_03305 [Alphaproteobacteria bacterium]|nr:hypothetical protein [Alphaproteobacteria bacterium]
MYHFIEDKDYVKRMKSVCSDLINQLVQNINKDDVMEVAAHLVGSGAKNLITQNAKERVDLDYNLEIIECWEYSINNCREIKTYIINKFNEVLRNNDWGDCKDSTSAITTEERVFKKGNKTPFSIDLCIVRTDKNGWYRLIHHKTGFVCYDDYIWNQARNSSDLQERVDWLKENDLWNEVRETYLDKKNMYLTRNDYDHNSFIIYIETINEVYDRY